jgi:hypothetical protein
MAEINPRFEHINGVSTSTGALLLGVRNRRNSKKEL